MRSPTPEAQIRVQPPVLRLSITNKAYLDLRRRILSGEFETGSLITPKAIHDRYHTNSNGTQSLLTRLTMEGLLIVSPVRERNWPNNASLAEYRVADREIRNRALVTQQSGVDHDGPQIIQGADNSPLALAVEFADDEIAHLLAVEPGDKVIYYRNWYFGDNDAPTAITDFYFPFWFVDVMPELNTSDKESTKDVYALMRQVGKNPAWCVDTLDVVFASSLERRAFDLSSDDPTPLLKVLRRTFDDTGQPLDVEFQTYRSDLYRLQYSSPLYSTGVPEPLRDK